MTNAKAVSEAKKGIRGYIEAKRTLASYPVGRQRWKMLALIVLATIISYYEFQYSALLPLWMSTLHFSSRAFAYFLVIAVLLSGLSAMLGGPLADRHGRVIVIDGCLAALIILTFLNLAMTGLWSFVVVRGAMNVTAGMMWGALSGITRDMSPRVSRGAAFGMLTLGLVGCNWLWTFVPGYTLPLVHAWQAEILIMGSLACIMFVPILLWLKDLHTPLRLAVIENEQNNVDVELPASASEPMCELPESSWGAYRDVLARYEVWSLAIGIVAFLTAAITIQTFGPLMFKEAFHYADAEAAKTVSFFWLLNAVMLVPAGFLTDRLRMRKPIALCAALVTLFLVIWWIPAFSHPLRPIALRLFMLVLGGLTALTYIPWTAQFSELLEDISPALQATGWAFFQLIDRCWIAISGPVIVLVSSRWGWATWTWAMAAGIAIFVVTELTARGGWRGFHSHARNRDSSVSLHPSAA